MGKVKLGREIKSLDQYYEAELIAEVLIDEDFGDVIRYSIVDKRSLTDNQFNSMVERLAEGSWKLFEAEVEESKPIIDFETDSAIRDLLQSFLSYHDETLTVSDHAVELFIKDLVKLNKEGK